MILQNCGMEFGGTILQNCEMEIGNGAAKLEWRF